MSAATSRRVDRRGAQVRWAELLPAAFRRRRKACPVVYLPVGLCEPHGEGAALGLDLLKAEAWCEAVARRAGGVVAPSVGFHIHESGPSARWLHDHVGQREAHLTSIGPTAFVHALLHQLRALANAEFRAALVVSGHAGAHAADLTALVAAFGRRFGFACRYVTDFELAAPEFTPDHAGRYEISLLSYLRPELVHSRRIRSDVTRAARFALDASAAHASAEMGRRIFSHLVARLAASSRALREQGRRARPRGPLTFAEVEGFWAVTRRRARAWHCAKPRVGQAAVPPGSRWKKGERLVP